MLEQEGYTLIGYAMISKGSHKLTLVENPKLHNLPHVFPVYARTTELEEKKPKE